MICRWCKSEIKEENWKYCMECGSITGFFKDLSSDGFEFPLPQGYIESTHCKCCESSSNESIYASKEFPDNFNIKLENTGIQPVKVKASLLDAPDWLKIKNGNKEFTLTKEYSISMSTQGNLPCNFNKNIFLEIKSSDGQRGDNNRWNKINWRSQKVPIKFTTHSVGKLNITEGLLTFNRQILERSFYVRNTGERCFRFIDIIIPDGFEFLSSDGMAVTKSSVSRWSLKGGQEEVFKIKLENIDDLQTLLNRQEKEKFILILKTCSGDTAEILLHIDKEEKIELVPPRYVIGVDFGTENTSVYYLDVLEDKIEPIKIKGDTRFPSYMYFYKGKPNEPPLYGREAIETAKVMIDEGDLVRDIKLLLQSDRNIYAEEYKNPRYTNEQLLVEFISFLRKEIEAFIKEKSQADVKVKYVFTLPVLDNAHKYQEQKEKMKKSISDVYYNKLNIEKDVLFIKEPQAAALYFFSSEALRQFALPPFKNKDVICIYDSGGGTTDIALLSINTGDGAKDSFDVLGTIGTEMPFKELFNSKKNKEKTVFAGRIVDETVLDLMLHNSTNKSNPSESDINLQRDYLFNNVYNGAFISTWIDIELCKRKLDDLETVNFYQYNPSIPEDKGFSATRSSLQNKVEPLIDGTIEMINSLKKNNNIKEIKYIFPIGGNSNFPLVEDKLKRSLGHLIDISSHMDVRMEAVARGSVLAYTNPFSNLIPYDIYWRLSGSVSRDWEQIFYENDGLCFNEIERSINVPSRSKINVLIGIGLVENKYCIGGFWIEPYVGDKSFRQDLLYFRISQDWTFYVEHKVVGTSIGEESFSYRLK